MDHKDFRNAYDADHRLPKPRLGEVFLYARKSNAVENCKKSIKDQHRANVRTCERYGLPVADETVLSEKPGLGGDVWWSDVSFGTENGRARTHRPEFSKIRDAILKENCKSVVAYSQCRFLRDVGICNALMDLCRDFGVRLYTADGLLDVWSSDGRAHMRYIASQDQRQREKAETDSARGVKEAVADGELVTVAGRLGFRSCGRHSKRVRIVEDEMEMVRWIFTAFVKGVDPQKGPMTIQDITKHLNATGYAWTPDLVEQRQQRNDFTKRLIYTWMVSRTLRHPSYCGKQRYKKGLVPCKAFLVDGKPVIDPELFRLAQEKMDNIRRSPRAPGKPKRAFSSLVKCGVCALTLTVMPSSSVRLADGSLDTRWTKGGYEANKPCGHDIVGIPVGELDQYFDQSLAPLLLAELEARSDADTVSALARRLERIQAEAAAVEKEMDEDLPRFMKEVSPKLLGQMEARLEEKLADLRTEGKSVERLMTDAATTRHRLEEVTSLPQALRNDLIREVVRWVAVVPSTSPRAVDRQGRTCPSADAGRLLFCTSYGFHTAIIRREWDEGRSVKKRSIKIRGAEMSDLLGGLDDLPSPPMFVQGLIRTATSARVEFCTETMAPGVHPETVEAAKALPPLIGTGSLGPLPGDRAA